MTPEEIEKNLAAYAEKLDVSAAKLRAVYIRGVNECLEHGYPGTPSTYGLARVQRFMIAMQSRNHRMTPDADFIASVPEGSVEPRTYEISEVISQSWPLIFNTMSQDGSQLSDRFPPESIEEVVYDEDESTLSVSGTYDSVQWSCTLNLTTGEHTFVTDVH